MFLVQIFTNVVFFLTAVFGILLTRNHVLTILTCVELLLLALSNKLHRPGRKAKSKPVGLSLDSLYDFVYSEALRFPDGFFCVLFLLNVVNLACSCLGLGLGPISGVDPILPPVSEQEPIDAPAEVPLTEAQTN